MYFKFIINLVFQDSPGSISHLSLCSSPKDTAASSNLSVPSNEASIRLATSSTVRPESLRTSNTPNLDAVNKVW